METKEESEHRAMVQEEVAPDVAAIRFVIEVADHDSNRVYKFSEACAEGHRYQHHVLKMPADPDSWFSLYELRKVGWPDPALHIDMSVREYQFASPDEAVLFIEQAFKACGYEARRRDNFNDVVYLSIERMTTDMAFMLSLLAAEHEWETSILHYKTDRKQYANPKYFVIADDVHTPHTKVKTAARSLASLPAEDVEVGAVRWRAEDAKQKLDFDDVENTPPTRVKAKNPVVKQLLALVGDGDMTMEELSRVMGALTPQKPAQVPRQSASAAPTRPESTWKLNHDVDNDLELTAHDDPFSNHQFGRHVTTVLQNVSIRTFDGGRGSAEDARAWLSKFLHSANISVDTKAASRSIRRQPHESCAILVQAATA
ncbi:hypothetical protein PINS_up016017 [Pythium insidiosum]|nr:hypothetical protein PINS_up016017 [Pythium insidiosum]